VLDDRGAICVRLIGLAARVLDKAPAASEPVGVVLCRPVWRAQTITSEAVQKKIARRVVVRCGIEATGSSVSWEGVAVIDLAVSTEDAAGQFQSIAAQALVIVRDLLTSRPGRRLRRKSSCRCVANGTSGAR